MTEIPAPEIPEDVELADDSSIHVRGLLIYVEGNNHISMLRTEIWPIPTELAEELAKHVEQEIFSWLLKKQVAAGDIVEVPLVAAGHKLQ